MTLSSLAPASQIFDWKCQPAAEQLILEILQSCLEGNKTLSELQFNLAKFTSTRIQDWVDHFSLGYSKDLENRLSDTGFTVISSTPTYRVFYHPGAQLPMVILKDHPDTVKEIAIISENIADFLMVRGIGGYIEGAPYSPYRRCHFNTENEIAFYIVERKGSLTMEPIIQGDDYLYRYIDGIELWQSRPRSLENEDEAMTLTLSIAEELILSLGKNQAAWVVLEVERKYWQSRNKAAQIQKSRQDRYGLGWANHDHHTFRSSRRHFHSLVRLFEMLGFYCRERFYAGAEAGWGAQVMENPEAKLILFLDVDLAPDELSFDFAHQHLSELPKLGTVGLWCALHGDSILKGGMHHLEAQFSFDDLTKDLAEVGIKMMDPFSSFDYLHQAFTVGEIWPVDSKRVKELVSSGKITQEMGDKFISNGAIGSHMENLQRTQGYKGFNQKNVSNIIQKTDPRKMQIASGA